MSVTLGNKSHRTALIIDGNAVDANLAFAERAGRLVESLNGNNIKVDIFVARGGAVVSAPTPGITRITDKSQLSAASGSVPAGSSVEAAVAAAKAAGYDQVLTSVSGK